MTTTSESLCSLYNSYKTSTKFALDWLRSQRYNSQGRAAKPCFNNTKEIIDAAKVLVSTPCKVPKSVTSAFRHAIATRRKVFEIYQALGDTDDLTQDEASEASACRHEAFINRLEEALEILLPFESKSGQSNASHTSERKASDSESNINRFAALDLAHDSQGMNTADTRPASPTSDLGKDGSMLAVRTGTDDLLLQDDEIGEWIQLSFFIYELDSILTKVDEFWTDAAFKKLPVALAAWLSTTAYHAVDRISSRIIGIAPDYNALVKKWFKHRKKNVQIRFKDIPELKSGTGRFAGFTALWFYSRLLHDCRTLEEYKTIIPDAGRRQDPVQIIQKPTGGDTDTIGSFSDHDDNAMDKMLESMRQLLVSKRAIAILEASEKPHHICEPLLPVVSDVLNDPNSPIPIHLGFGMEMLLSSYKAYLWPNGQLNKTNCRISTLHFAKEVEKSILAAITCLESINNHEYFFSEFEKTILKERYAGLQLYTSEQRFDLYYQAPWTSGCHMVEILHLAICEGLHLCCGSGYVCALLHLYNALRTLDPKMERNTLLDQLCQVFSDSLFLGTLPTENFSSHFRRAMGGLLNPKSNTGSSGRISKPASSTSTRRVAPAKLSMFYDLHNSCYQTTSDFWVQVYTDKNLRRPSKSQHRIAVDQVHSAPFNVALEKIKGAVLPEFNGDLPVARINYFSIYIFCTKLIEDVGRAINGPAGSAVGFELVDMLLEEMVEHLRDDHKRHLLPYFRPLKLAKGVFSELDGNISLLQYLWDI